MYSSKEQLQGSRSSETLTGLPSCKSEKDCGGKFRPELLFAALYMYTAEKTLDTREYMVCMTLYTVRVNPL